MPTAQPSAPPPSSSSPSSPSPSPPPPSAAYRFPPPSSSSFSSLSSSSHPTRDPSQGPHWHHTQPAHSHTHSHSHPHPDRPTKDEPLDPYSSLSHSSSSSSSSPPPPLPPQPASSLHSSHHPYYSQNHQNYHHHSESYQQAHHHHRSDTDSNNYNHESSIYRPISDQAHARRGHRYSIDSAAADTLLMLSAAAFMDPATARSVLATDQGDKRTGSYHQHHHNGSYGHPYRHDSHYRSLEHSHPPHTAYSHQQRQHSPSAPEPFRLHAMSKTVSAPASSLHLPPLSLSRNRSHHHYHRHQQQQQQQDHSSDMEIEPRPSSPLLAASKHPAFVPDRSCPTREHSPSSLGVNEPAHSLGRHQPSTLVSSAGVTIDGPLASVSGNTDGFIPGGYADVKHRRDRDNKVHADEEEEEDEVMSVGVVHMNAKLAPVTLSPQGKTRSSNKSSLPLPPLPPSISTSASVLHQDQDSPKTPTSARTPRTPKQTRAPKLPKIPRTPKRSQSDYQPNSSGVGSGGRGRGNQRDGHGDYFFSPFPPSASPASSPSSSLSFQAQLQSLTHNFVSVQAHASPTSRFRRTLSSHTAAATVPVATTATAIATATPPVSPPVSPGVDLIRDLPFHFGSASATTSPTKGSSYSSSNAQGTAPSTPTSTTFSRPGSKVNTPLRTHFKPRWHTQPYMMFLALRAMPDRTAARQELIMAAVELDKKFSAEKGLPRVFTGKTPMNSASACLTNNGDKYFIPFKPEGSRSTHFQLAYEPGDFDTAVKEYNDWMEQLIRRDWPLCFGVPKKDALPLEMEEQAGSQRVVIKEGRPEMQRAYSSPESRKRGADVSEQGQETKLGNSKKLKAETGTEDENENETLKHESIESREERKVADSMQRLDIKAAGSYDGSLSCPPTPTATNSAAAIEPSEERPKVQRFRLEDLDLQNVPTCLEDIVRVDVSMIPNAGNGLFAKTDLPAGTPLGFYFGVPLTENEFDSLKDGVGLASQYSVMYRRTVLDATDDDGQPYTDPNGPVYCPFHFMNEDPDGNVSFITGSVVNQVICTTNRDIKAGEELLVFFGREMVDRSWGLQAQDAAAAAGMGSGAGETMEGKRSRGGSRSRASSPTRRPAEDGGRPRRETVHKPVRYTR